MIKHHLLKATEVNNASFSAGEDQGSLVTTLSCLLEDIQCLKNRTLASTILTKDECDGCKINANASSKRLEVFEFNCLEHQSTFVEFDPKFNYWLSVSSSLSGSRQLRMSPRCVSLKCNTQPF